MIINYINFLNQNKNVKKIYIIVKIFNKKIYIDYEIL